MASQYATGKVNRDLESVVSAIPKLYIHNIVLVLVLCKISLIIFYFFMMVQNFKSVNI